MTGEIRGALRLARREFGGAARRMLPAFAILSFAIGCLIVVWCIQVTASEKIAGDSKAWLAADVSITYDELPDDGTETGMFAEWQRPGMRQTITYELFTAVSSAEAPDPMLAVIKVVDASEYPYYGAVRLSPDAPLRAVLNAETAVVSLDGLRKLGIMAGQEIRVVRINGAPFRVAAALLDEPDRLAAAPNFYPRVILSKEGFLRTRLQASGAELRYRALLRLPRGMDAQSIRASIENVLPDALVLDWREADPGTTRVLDACISFLRLMAWFALVISAVTSAIAAHSMMIHRLDAVAVVKALGGRTCVVFAGYMLPVLWTGLAAVPLGCVLGAAMQAGVLRLLGPTFPVMLDFHWDWRIAAEAAALGVGMAVAAAAVPLYRACRTPVLRVLRRDVEVMAGSNWPAMLAGGAVLLASGMWIIEQRQLAGLMAGAAVVSIGALALAARAMVALGGRVARLGLLRPRAGSSSIVVALGAGVMILACCGFAGHGLRTALIGALPIPGGGDLHLMALRRHSLQQIAGLLESQAAVKGPVQPLPLLLGLRLERPVRAGSRRLWGATCRDDVPGLVISEENAAEIGAVVNDIVEFRVKGRTLSERVALVRPMDRIGNFRLGLVFPCRAFQGFDPVYEAGVRIVRGREAEVRRILAERFPWAPILSRDETVHLIEQAVGRAIGLMRLLSAVLIGCGALIMTLLLGAQRRRRLREVAIWKALGGTRRSVRSALVGEMAILGVIVGVVGNAGGTVLASLFLSYLLGRPALAFEPTQALLVFGISVAVAVGTGYFAGRRMLDSRPLQLLRNEAF